MLSLCLCGFAPDTQASSHSLNTCMFGQLESLDCQ
uniref:Uncharacterized protein n=1 Tax=Anguilla anguilla TaxID=7936 RepID=A0A0E9SG21_ANGAN